MHQEAQIGARAEVTQGQTSYDNILTQLNQLQIDNEALREIVRQTAAEMAKGRAREDNYLQELNYMWEMLHELQDAVDEGATWRGKVMEFHTKVVPLYARVEENTKIIKTLEQAINK